MSDQIDGMRTSDESEATETRSNWWRLQAIFLEPDETFREIARKPNVLLPWIALVLVGLATNFFVINQIGYENLIRQQITQNPQIQEMSAEQREEIIEAQSNSTLIRALSYAGPIVGGIFILLVAVLLLGGARLMGSEASYKHILSVTCHSYFAYGVVSGALLSLVVWLTGDKTSIDPRDAVMSHLGFLADKADSPVLYTLVSSFDVLTFYAIFLLALGISKMDRKPSFSGALGIVGFWWAIWVLAKTGLAALFS